LADQAGQNAEGSDDGAWEFSESERNIDDVIVRYATLPANEHQCGLSPQLLCRTELKQCSVIRSAIIDFGTKVFSIRDELLPATVRFDQTDSLKRSISASETGNACFLAEPHILITRLLEASRLLVAIQLMRFGTRTFEFKVRGFDGVQSKLLAGAVGATAKQLLGFNSELVDHVFRLGPRNVDALIEVLCTEKLIATEQIGAARRKELLLFAAAQALGEKYHVSEIYGFTEGRRINDMFAMVVYNKLSAATRGVVGKLMISE
jgi:hypothetical protein